MAEATTKQRQGKPFCGKTSERQPGQTTGQRIALRHGFATLGADDCRRLRKPVG